MPWKIAKPFTSTDSSQLTHFIFICTIDFYHFIKSTKQNNCKFLLLDSFSLREKFKSLNIVGCIPVYKLLNYCIHLCVHSKVLLMFGTECMRHCYATCRDDSAQLEPWAQSALLYDWSNKSLHQISPQQQYIRSNVWHTVQTVVQVRVSVERKDHALWSRHFIILALIHARTGGH